MDTSLEIEHTFESPVSTPELSGEASSATTPLLQIPPSIYFGGCANGLIFYIGIYKAMIEKWGIDFAKKTKIYGDSASVIMVLGITRQFTPEKLYNLYYNNSINSPIGLISGINILEDSVLTKLLDDFKDPDLYKELNNKMYIGGSRFFAKHFWTCNWNSNEELYNCIIESLNIPILSYSKNKRNNYVIDGAYVFSGDNLPDGDSTLYIAGYPFSDIYIPMTHNELFFPHLHEKMDNSFQRGYEAFMNWDGKYKKKVGKRKPNYGIQFFLWILYIIESIFDFMYCFGEEFSNKILLMY